MIARIQAAEIGNYLKIRRVILSHAAIPPGYGTRAERPAGWDKVKPLAAVGKGDGNRVGEDAFTNGVLFIGRDNPDNDSKQERNQDGYDALERIERNISFYEPNSWRPIHPSMAQRGVVQFHRHACRCTNWSKADSSCLRRDSAKVAHCAPQKSHRFLQRPQLQWHPCFSVMPKAARCRVPKSRSTSGFSDKGSIQLPASRRSSRTMTAPSCRLVCLLKMVNKRSTETSASMCTPVSMCLLQTGTPLDNHERTGLLAAQCPRRTRQGCQKFRGGVGCPTPSKERGRPRRSKARRSRAEK